MPSENAFELEQIKEGNFGKLKDVETNEVIRDATRDEAWASLGEGDEGIITVDGRKVFVDWR